MSGYGPFSWSYGISVLKTIAEPTWHYKRQDKEDKVEWEARDKDYYSSPRLPFATYMGWALLRITLCIDMALINEMVGFFVLSAVHYKPYTRDTHKDPYAVTFIGVVGGAISTIFVLIVDIIYSKPERRERWPMIDPNATISTTTKEDDVLGMISQALNGGLAVKKPKGTDGKDAGSWNLPLRGDKRDAKNMTEGGPITHKKLRVHALMRIVIWNIAAIAAGAIGTAIWFAKEGRIVKRMDERIGTGIIVQVVGVAVIVVGPTLIQLLYLTVEIAETGRNRRQKRNKDSKS